MDEAALAKKINEDCIALLKQLQEVNGGGWDLIKHHLTEAQTRAHALSITKAI